MYICIYTYVYYIHIAIYIYICMTWLIETESTRWHASHYTSNRSAPPLYHIISIPLDCISNLSIIYEALSDPSHTYRDVHVSLEIMMSVLLTAYSMYGGAIKYVLASFTNRYLSGDSKLNEFKNHQKWEERKLHSIWKTILKPCMITCEYMHLIPNKTMQIKWFKNSPAHLLSAYAKHMEHSNNIISESNQSYKSNS